MARELTAEERVEMQQFIDDFTEAGLPTEEIDVEFAREKTKGLYKLLNIEQPEVKLFNGPKEAWEYICELAGQKMEFVFPPYTGAMQMGLIGVAEFLKYKFGEEMPEAYDLYKPCTELTLIWPLDEVCVCTQPPYFYRFDEEYQLHCEDGPAVEFRDGVKVWCINGIDVDEQIVMRPQTQTIEQIMDETNTDVRAIRIERYGWLKFLGDVNADTVDEHVNDVEGTLETLFATKVGMRFVATCNTGRIICLSVPDGTQTCAEARLYLQRGDSTMNIVGRT